MTLLVFVFSRLRLWTIDCIGCLKRGTANCFHFLKWGKWPGLLLLLSPKMNFRLVLSFDHCDCNDSWQLSMIVYAWCGKSDPDAWDVDRVIIQFFCLVFMILLSCFLFPNSTSFTQAMRWKCSGIMLLLRAGSLSEVKLEFFGFSILEFDNSTFIVDHGA